jgi:hypothetical protein
MTFQTIKMAVSKTVAGKREPVGAVDIHIPTLADIGVKAVQAIDKEDGNKPVVNSDGLPVYEDDIHNWLQDAITDKAKNQARNKLEAGSVTLKDGAKIATDWKELTAVNVGGGNIEALAKAREFKALVNSWVASLGKTPQATAQLSGLLNAPASIALQPATTKEKLGAYLQDFMNTLADDVLAKFEKQLATLEASLTGELAEDF